MRYSTATPLELERLKKDMRFFKVTEGAQWSTEEEYEDKRREVSLTDTRKGLVVQLRHI